MYLCIHVYFNLIFLILSGGINLFKYAHVSLDLMCEDLFMRLSTTLKFSSTRKQQIVKLLLLEVGTL